MSRRALLLIVGLGAVAVALTWIGISIFSTDPIPAPDEAAPVVSDVPPPPPATETMPEQPDAPPSPVNEVIPAVPRSALDTIRGTVRVSVRVTLDKDGTVLTATADDRGPSRYFERLALEASKKWTFTPTDSEEQRMMLLRFNFARAGATARAEAL